MAKVFTRSAAVETSTSKVEKTILGYLNLGVQTKSGVVPLQRYGVELVEGNALHEKLYEVAKAGDIEKLSQLLVISSFGDNLKEKPEIELDL